MMNKEDFLKIILKDFLNQIDEVDEDDEREVKSSDANEKWESEYYTMTIIYLIPIVVILDVIYLVKSENWGAPLVIGIFQILYFVILFPPVKQVFKDILSAYMRRK